MYAYIRVQSCFIVKVIMVECNQAEYEEYDNRICPFNHSHQITPGKFQSHARKCRDNYEKKHQKVYLCRYGVLHLFVNESE